jgi:hypothetical protein
MKEFFIRFETDLNASMYITICAKTYNSAKKKILKMFPSAFNFD